MVLIAITAESDKDIWVYVCYKNSNTSLPFMNRGKEITRT